MSAFAQVEKNAIYPELSVGRTLFNYNTNTVQTGVSIGLSEHSTLGVFYAHTRYESSPLFSSETNGKSNRYGISYTYYSYFKNSKKWGWSLNGSASINRYNTLYKPTSSPAVNYKGTDKELSITPGVFFKPSAKVMLTANIGGVTIYNSRYQVGSGYSNFGGQLNLGVRVNLFGHKKR